MSEVMLPLVMPTDEDRRIKISAVTLTQRHNCTVRHITAPGGCGGGCCRQPKYWPPSSTEAGRLGLGCSWLGPDGCRMTADQRPLTCNLYPLRFTPNGRGLSLHFVTRFPNSVCCGAYKEGPMLVDALAEGLCAVFGVEQWLNMKERALDGRDTTLILSRHTYAQLQRELQWEAANEVPQPREDDPDASPDH